MTPLSGKPAVVVVQPADHGANIEGAVYRVEYVWGTRYPRAIRNSRSFDDRAQELGAFFEAESFKTAADSIKENVAGRVILQVISVSITCSLERDEAQGRSQNLTARSESIS